MAYWGLLGAPLESSGERRGEERGVGALRSAGLVERLGAEDAGDIEARLQSPVRDSETGIISYEQLRLASAEILASVSALLDRAARPLVVGGDCSLLPGALAAAHRSLGRTGLAFVDGHLDFFDGRTSPTGEAADMELAIVTGHGPPGLVDLAGPPIVDPSNVAVLGYRIEAPGDAPREADLVDDGISRMEAREVSQAGPARLGGQVADRLAEDSGRFWVHFDVDVFDASEMPAVSYPQPDGLDWSEVSALLRPLVESPALVGLSVADFDPDLDPDGAYARRLVELLAGLLAP